MYSHTLIIGGTGMLREASLALAAASHRLTSVARTRRSLAALDRALPAGHGLHHMLALDWRGQEAFLARIAQHIDRTVPPDLVVAWVHDVRFGVRLAEMLRAGGARFFHVIGSANEDPAMVAAQAMAGLRSPRMAAYRQIVLGAVRGGGRARWLTDDEISRGVLAAIRADRPRFIVGSLGAASDRDAGG